MRPTTRDLVGIAIFVLLLVALLVVFVAAALPPAHP
jgi:preprotein translocase subunit SecE